MRWSWRILLIISVFALAGIVGCAGHHRRHHGKMGGHGKHNVLHTCACGPQCQCGAASIEPGKCGCGKDLVPGHVLRVEGTEALVCQCGRECMCKLNPKDSTKCGCGKPVKRVNLEGKGIHFCNCGGSCGCNYLSNESMKCKCGMNLKKAE